MKNTKISWAHHSLNFWYGCDKCAPECLNCYIKTTMQRGGMSKITPFGGPLQLASGQQWANPRHWQREAASVVGDRPSTGPAQAQRVFTCSLSDFFHAKADKQRMPVGYGMLPTKKRPEFMIYTGMTWRDAAWDLIKATPNLIWMVLTKRPELIKSRLPKDWGIGYKNVWLGTSVGCNKTLSKIDSLRKIPVHPEAVRFVSCEPLLEDISEKIDLTGIGWLIAGGESGGKSPEVLHDPKIKLHLTQSDVTHNRRFMDVSWAFKLFQMCQRRSIPFWFKQISAPRSGVGADALIGMEIHEVPNAHSGLPWAPYKEKQP